MLQALHPGCKEQCVHYVGKPREVGNCMQCCAPAIFLSTAVKPPMSSLPSSSARLKALSLASAELYLTTPLGAPCKGATSRPFSSKEPDISIALYLSQFLSMLVMNVMMRRREALDRPPATEGAWPAKSHKQLRLSLWQTGVHIEGSATRCRAESRSSPSGTPQSGCSGRHRHTGSP